MKALFTSVATAVTAKQMTVAVALITTAFVIVQASSTPRNRSANIDDGSDLANSAIVRSDSFSQIAAEPAMNSPTASTTAASSPEVAAQAIASAAHSASGMRALASSFSADDRSLPSGGIGLLASNRPLTSQAFALNGIGSASGLSSPSRATSANETFGGAAAGSGSGGGSSGSFAGNPVPANSRTDALANSISETPTSTALANTNNSFTGLSSDRYPEPAQNNSPADEGIALHETTGSPASNPLDFSSAIGDTLDLMAMKIGEVESGLPAAVSLADDDIASVASVPEAGHTLWLLSAAIVGLMAYGQRFSVRLCCDSGPRGSAHSRAL